MNLGVSIICNTYNQEQYIREALNGFVMQKTSFPFEVLIHDDASTDNTPMIIGEFVNKYPEIIKPIFQIENQYSKKISITKTYQFPRVQGKYIAFCEGDDFWTDPLKLQKQYNALENNPRIDICTHKAAKERDRKIVGYINPRNNDCVIPVEDVILGGGSFVATNSIMIRSSVLLNETPMMKIMSLDYVWQVQGSLSGGMIYIKDCMSVYRVGVSGSWSNTMRSNVEAQVKHLQKVDSLFEALDFYTNNKYHDIIEEKKRINKFKVLYYQGEYRKLLKKEYRSVFHSKPLKVKLKILLNSLLSKKKGA